MIFNQVKRFAFDEMYVKMFSKERFMKRFFKIFISVLLVLGIFGVGGYFTYRFFRDRKNKQEVDFSAMTYVALGDSITHGKNIFDEGKDFLDFPYCQLVKQTLNLKNVTNYGVNGSTVSNAAGASAPFAIRYADMVDADIVSVMGGINDILRSCPLGQPSDVAIDTFYGALDVLAKGLKEKYPNSFIFFMTPLKVKKCENNIEKRASVQQYNQAIKDVCARYEIPVIDTYLLCDFSTEYNSEGYIGDGVHPSQEFNTSVLAPTIAQFIKDNYKAK